MCRTNDLLVVKIIYCKYAKKTKLTTISERGLHKDETLLEY